MAGHSKWANIKHRKDRSDRKKGKIFSRIIKEIMSAVRQGGADPKSNTKLKVAIQKAKDANVPNENVDRNIKKASGAGQEDFVEVTYELYGYGGVGILAVAMTDNKNRLSSDIRIATNKCGGTIATHGSVAYQFDRKGVLRLLKGCMKEDAIFLLVSEAGAEDLLDEEDQWVVITSVEQFVKVKEALDHAQVKCEEASLEMVPRALVEVSDEFFDENMALIDYLEQLDDVDAVYHNMGMPLK